MVINSKLYGNSVVWHNLVNDCLTNHIAHAYIFSGTQGIGKSLMAKEYIKYILKANDVLSERIDDNSFLDLLYISKQDKNEIGIDSIRKAGDFFKHTATEGNSKFVIIDSADDLNRNAANALLKILEEPAKNTYLFLISHSVRKLLPTIRSRCRIIKFPPLTVKDLKLLSPQYNVSIMEDYIAGSAGRALIAEEKEVIKLYERILNLVDNYGIIEFNNFAELLTKKNDQWDLVKDLLIYLINRCLKFISNKHDNMMEIELSILEKLANKKSVEEWFKVYDELLAMFNQTDIYNLDKKQALLISIDSIRK